MKEKRVVFFSSVLVAGFFLNAQLMWAADQNATQKMYRLYNANTGEHFYTSNIRERDRLDDLGWAYEGIGWIAPEKSDKPVYRVYNDNTGDHHYTVSLGEKKYLVSMGWKDEGIGWYSADSEKIPVYRQYNPNARSGAHNYTISKTENDRLSMLGWQTEGIGWYAAKANSVENDDRPTEKIIEWNKNWPYASFSKIYTARPKIYFSTAKFRRGKIVAVNAGHGTMGGDRVRTLCHPDGTVKVTGGSTQKGSTTAEAAAAGTIMMDGTSEADANLALANKVKVELLAEGYDVLMIRENRDCQLDNIARTVIANQYADCLIIIHYDSSRKNKGAFCIGVPDIVSYRMMEPVKSHWQEHEALTQALINGLNQKKVTLYQSGYIQEDLTQTSYSTIPAVCIEAGDAASDRSDKTLNQMAQAIVSGVSQYFRK